MRRPISVNSSRKTCRRWNMYTHAWKQWVSSITKIGFHMNTLLLCNASRWIVISLNCHFQSSTHTWFLCFEDEAKNSKDKLASSIFDSWPEQRRNHCSGFNTPRFTRLWCQNTAISHSIYSNVSILISDSGSRARNVCGSESSAFHDASHVAWYLYYYTKPNERLVSMHPASSPPPPAAPGGGEEQGPLSRSSFPTFGREGVCRSGCRSTI